MVKIYLAGASILRSGRVYDGVSVRCSDEAQSETVQVSLVGFNA